jgi:c-di-GMP-binding flagellar brake protein YcgR
MFDDFDGPAEAINTDEAFNLLQELGRNTSEEIRRQRQHFRVTIKAGVTLQSGNASELLDYKVKGVSGDISEGGCSVLFPIPIHVGDVYRLQFDRQVVDLPLTFARCLRCRLVREDAYEAGFLFFTPIVLPENLYGHVQQGQS